MNKIELLDKIRGELVISCQAFEGNPFYGADNMVKMAKSAEISGAKCVRICWPEQVKAVKESTNLIVIGIFKKFEEGMTIEKDIVITPSYHEAKELIESGADIVALDGTLRGRKESELEQLVKKIKNHYPMVPLMADISTLEEAKFCEKIGFDIVSSTLSGYTYYTKNRCDGSPDYELVKQMKKKLKCMINAEGRIWDVEQLKKMKSLRPDMITIGTAITNPMLIARRFVNAFKENDYE